MESTEPLVPVMLADDCTEFMANGHRYTILRDVTRLPLALYREFERFSIEVGYTASFPFIDSQLLTAMKYCSPTDYNMAFTILYNLRQGMTDLKNKYSPMLHICCLFITREQEPWGVFNPALNEQKIMDWELAGINVGFFLDLAEAILNGFSSIYNSTSRQYSELPVSPNFQQERVASLSAGQNESGN